MGLRQVLWLKKGSAPPAQVCAGWRSELAEPSGRDRPLQAAMMCIQPSGVPQEGLDSPPRNTGITGEGAINPTPLQS